MLKFAYDALVCPACGSEYLHHGKIAIFARDEDADVGLHVTIDDEFRLAVDGNVGEDHGNPSSRRDGLLVWFWCERCKAEPVLAIAQHKGNTFMDWQPPYDEEPPVIDVG